MIFSTSQIALFVVFVVGLFAVGIGLMQLDRLLSARTDESESQAVTAEPAPTHHKPSSGKPHRRHGR
jgi:hypothetical protein